MVAAGIAGAPRARIRRKGRRIAHQAVRVLYRVGVFVLDAHELRARDGRDQTGGQHGRGRSHPAENNGVETHTVDRVACPTAMRQGCTLTPRPGCYDPLPKPSVNKPTSDRSSAETPARRTRPLPMLASAAWAPGALCLAAGGFVAALLHASVTRPLPNQPLPPSVAEAIASWQVSDVCLTPHDDLRHPGWGRDEQSRIASPVLPDPRPARWFVRPVAWSMAR